MAVAPLVAIITEGDAPKASLAAVKITIVILDKKNKTTAYAKTKAGADVNGIVMAEVLGAGNGKGMYIYFYDNYDPREEYLYFIDGDSDEVVGITAPERYKWDVLDYYKAQG